MPKKMISEVPRTPDQSVTLTYLHNHLFQVMAWIGQLNGQKESKKLETAYEHIETAQGLINELIESEK